MTINERVKHFRKDVLQISQANFADKLGMKQTGISYMEREGSTVTDQTIKSICLLYHVNEDWLRNGTGEMFVKLSRDDQIAAFVGDLLKDEEDSFKRRLISALAGLDDDGWDFLDQFLDSVQKKKNQE